MATTLPPLISATSNRDVLSRPSSRKRSGRYCGPSSVRAKSSADALPPPTSAHARSNKFEKDFFAKQEKLVKRLPRLNPFQISEYKSDDKKNACTYLLRKGLHKSFREMVDLIRIQEERRREAGPDSFLWHEPLLVRQPDKLNFLKVGLEKAEMQLLMGDYESVYNSHKSIAEIFTASEDLWLRQHFFENCLKWSQQIKNDGGRKQSEAHRNMATSFSSSGDLTKALRHFELAKQLRIGWEKEDAEEGGNLLRESCKDLATVNQALATRAHLDKRIQESFRLYAKALEAAVESRDEEIIANCNYNLGHMHAFHGDAEAAIKYLRHYYAYCLTADDNSGVAKCCQDFSKAYEREGNLEENMKYLDKFILVAERTKNERIIAEANATLGVRLNTLRQYGKAVACFERAFTLSRKCDRLDRNVVDFNRCFTGIAEANRMLGGYLRCLISASDSKDQLIQLVEWKNERNDLYTD